MKVMNKKLLVPHGTSGTLALALRKSVYSKMQECWYGQFTPMQILALVEAGAISTSRREYAKVDLAWVKKLKEEGVGGLQWFYFHPPKGLVQFK